MTRAEERLILSGAVEPDKWLAGARARGRAAVLWMGAASLRAGPRATLLARHAGDRARWPAAACRPPAGGADRAAAAGRAGACRRGAPASSCRSRPARRRARRSRPPSLAAARRPRRRAGRPTRAPRARPARVGSATPRLSRYAACPYRWYLERVLRLPEQDPGAAATPPSPGRRPARSTRCVRGSLVARAARGPRLRARPRSRTTTRCGSSRGRHEVELTDERRRRPPRPGRRVRRRAAGRAARRPRPTSTASTVRVALGDGTRRCSTASSTSRLRGRRHRAGRRLQVRRGRADVDLEALVEAVLRRPAADLRARVRCAAGAPGGRGRPPLPRAPGRAGRRALRGRRRASARGARSATRRAACWPASSRSTERPHRALCLDLPRAPRRCARSGMPRASRCVRRCRRRRQHRRPAAPRGPARSSSAFSSAPKQQRAAGQPQPQQQDDDRARRPVGGAVAGEVLDVDGEADRRDDPDHDPGDGARRDPAHPARA